MRLCNICGKKSVDRRGYCCACGAQQKEMASNNPDEEVAADISGKLAKDSGALPQKKRQKTRLAGVPVKRFDGKSLEEKRPDGAKRDATTPESEQHTSCVKLVELDDDGGRQNEFFVKDGGFEIGRQWGNVCFSDDPFLSDRHCRIELRNGVWFVVDLDSLNGVYLRIRKQCELTSGDFVLVGRQVLRFCEPSAAESASTPVVQHGVHLFGSPLEPFWARADRFTVAGTCRDVYYLRRPETVVGRENADITFSDDRFLSRKHCVIRHSEHWASLDDLNSANGTYLRIRGEERLQNADILRIGNQIFRLEVTHS